MSNKVEGKVGISAEVLCHSVSEQGQEILTYVLEYPRMIHSEIMTHRLISRNAASSRAIPFAKMKEQLRGVPVRFGKNVSGMQDSGDHKEFVKLYQFMPVVTSDAYEGMFEQSEYSFTPEQAWEEAKESAISFSEAFSVAGFHKQVFNRLTEPFQMMRTIVTATEWDNFFWLRNHEAADPTLHELARCMWEAKQQSTPQLLKAGQWHLPYVDCSFSSSGQTFFNMKAEDDEYCLSEQWTLEQAIKVSAARCAAVSFRNVDYGLEKCLEVYDRLVGDDRKHASAFEHQGTPIETPKLGNTRIESMVNVAIFPETWEKGISHMDRDKNFWSGNLKGWIQFRKLIPGECYNETI